MKYLLLNIIVLMVSLSSLKGQTTFYQDVFYGGVTGSGFSLGSNASSSANGQFILNINPSSTIKKAFLFYNRYGNPNPLNITFNSNNYVFVNSNQVSNNFLTFASLVDTIICAIHAIDVTNEINSSQNVYNILCPSQPMSVGLNNTYGAYYLLVLYENASLPKTAISVVLNNKNMIGNVNYSIINLLPIDTLNPVGMAIHSDIIWDTIQDGSNIFVNGNNLGLIGGSDAINNTWIGAGVKGHFFYQNNTLFGLDDDTPDSLMKGTDGLADIKSYINYGTTSFLTSLIKQPTAIYNIYLAFFLTYTTPCDTFTTTATATQDTICKGETVQLNATGGLQYSWFGAFGGLSDTSIANPMASPPQTTTYIVTIKNDSGCVKTEHVKIWVRPEPKPNTIVIAPQTCGNQDGSITVGNIPQGTPPFTYTLTNLQTNTSTTQANNVFSQLSTFNFQLLTVDANGCTWQSDTLFVPQLNNVTASFNSIPQAPFSNPPQPLGKAPMEVGFFNTSQNANTYLWSITQQPNNDTIVEIPACAGMTSSCGLQHFFTQGGVFEVCLIAYNNLPQCADTICKTIFIDNNENVSVFIPNVFTPNGDNENDDFVLQLIGAELLESLEVEVFNRWGQTVESRKWEIGSLASAMDNSPSGLGALVVWNGTTTSGKKASEGTYFYVVSYKTKQGETVTEKGTVTLLR